MRQDVTATEPTRKAKPRARSRFDLWTQWLALGLSVVLLIALSALYKLQPDGLAALTVWPAWVLAIPGVFLALFGFRRRAWRPFVAVLALWAIFALVFVDESRSLLRIGGWPSTEWTKAHEQGKAVRVVTLNCMVNNWDAGREVIAQNPDIVLFQEAPNKQGLEEIAHRLYGDNYGIVTGDDTAIIARGSAEETTPETLKGLRYVEARVRLPSGLTLEAASIHLQSVHRMLNYRSRQTWENYTRGRLNHREWMAEIGEQLSSLPENLPLLVAGDFNSSAHDAIFDLMPSRLQDTFSAAGRGWGATYPNKLPIVRIDQVWASNRFQPVGVFAQTTQHSDHRMTVCDLLIRPQ